MCVSENNLANFTVTPGLREQQGSVFQKLESVRWYKPTPIPKLQNRHKQHIANRKQPVPEYNPTPLHLLRKQKKSQEITDVRVENTSSASLSTPCAIPLDRTQSSEHQTHSKTDLAPAQSDFKSTNETGTSNALETELSVDKTCEKPTLDSSSQKRDQSCVDPTPTAPTGERDTTASQNDQLDSTLNKQSGDKPPENEHAAVLCDENDIEQVKETDKSKSNHDGVDIQEKSCLDQSDVIVIETNEKPEIICIDSGDENPTVTDGQTSLKRKRSTSCSNSNHKDSDHDSKHHSPKKKPKDSKHDSSRHKSSSRSKDNERSKSSHRHSSSNSSHKNKDHSHSKSSSKDKTSSNDRKSKHNSTSSRSTTSDRHKSSSRSTTSDRHKSSSRSTTSDRHKSSSSHHKSSHRDKSDRSKSSSEHNKSCDNTSNNKTSSKAAIKQEPNTTEQNSKQSRQQATDGAGGAGSNLFDMFANINGVHRIKKEKSDDTNKNTSSPSDGGKNRPSSTAKAAPERSVSFVDIFGEDSDTEASTATSKTGGGDKTSKAAAAAPIVSRSNSSAGSRKSSTEQQQRGINLINEGDSDGNDADVLSSSSSDNDTDAGRFDDVTDKLRSKLLSAVTSSRNKNADSDDAERQPIMGKARTARITESQNKTVSAANRCSIIS